MRAGGASKSPIHKQASLAARLIYMTNVWKQYINLIEQNLCTVDSKECDKLKSMQGRL